MSEKTASDHIEIEMHGAVQLVRMRRPEKKNALTTAMYWAMAVALDRADADGAVRAVVFAGVPGAFSAGNDLADFLQGFDASALRDVPVIAFLHRLAAFGKPLLAAVDGLAVGVGTTLLMHCDHVVAGAGTTFSTPFAALGLVPEAASSLIAPRIMGHQRAFSLLVMGRPMNAEDALRAGLVAAVTEAGQAEAAALAAAQALAKMPAEAVAAGRRLLRGNVDEIHARIDHEAALFAERMQSPEARAAFAAFLGRKA